MSKELRIFEIRSGGEKQWVCAYTNIQALKVLLDIEDCRLNEYDDDDEIVEVPKEAWPIFKIINSGYDELDAEDSPSITAEEYMKTATKPDIIATTLF